MYQVPEDTRKILRCITAMNAHTLVPKEGKCSDELIRASAQMQLIIAQILLAPSEKTSREWVNLLKKMFAPTYEIAERMVQEEFAGEYVDA